MPNPILAILDSPNQESKAAGTFNIPMPFRLMMSNGFDSFGSTPITSAGPIITPVMPNWYNAVILTPQIPVANLQGTTSDAVAFNAPFLLPDHGPLSISGFSATINVGYANANGNTTYLDSLDIVFSSIDSTGAETVLNTTTKGSLGLSTTITTYQSSTVSVTAAFSSPLVVASGHRLCIRIKPTGRGSIANVAYFALNADGGTYTTPTISGTKDSWITLRM